MSSSFWPVLSTDGVDRFGIGYSRIFHLGYFLASIFHGISGSLIYGNTWCCEAVDTQFQLTFVLICGSLKERSFLLNLEQLISYELHHPFLSAQSLVL